MVKIGSTKGNKPDIMADKLVVSHMEHGSTQVLLGGSVGGSLGRLLIGSTIDICGAVQRDVRGGILKRSLVGWHGVKRIVGSLSGNVLN
jgi:hypothetical protein